MGYKTYSFKEDGIYREDWGGEEGVMNYESMYDEQASWGYGGGEQKIINSHPDMAAGKKYDSTSPLTAYSFGLKILEEVQKSQDKLIQMTGGGVPLEEEPELEAETAAKIVSGIVGKDITGEEIEEPTDEKVIQQEVEKEEPSARVPGGDWNAEIWKKLRQIVSWTLGYGENEFDRYLVWKEADDEGMVTSDTQYVDQKTDEYFKLWEDKKWSRNYVLRMHEDTFTKWEARRDDYFKDQGVHGKFEQRTKDDIITDYTGGSRWDFNLQGGSKNDFLDELLNWYKTNPETKDYDNQHLFDAIGADLSYINNWQGLKEENLWSIGPDGPDGELLYFKIFGSGRGKITLDDTERTVQDQVTPFKAGYNQTGWSDIYETHMRKQVGISSPSLWQHAMNQGLGNDPLQRTIYSQFQLQGRQDDPWAGDLTGSLLKQDMAGGLSLPGTEYSEVSPNRNPYDEFLQNYRPMEGTELTDTIGQVISTITNESWEGYQPGRGGKGDYSDEELRNFRWRDNYLDGPNSEQHQKSLAALPIMQATPLALRAETSNMLEYLHTAWKSDPNRDVKEGWLEYVHKNNYFGMIPKDTGSQPQSMLRDWEEEEKYYTKAPPSSEGRDYTPSYGFESWV